VDTAFVIVVLAPLPLVIALVRAASGVSPAAAFRTGFVVSGLILLAVALLVSSDGDRGPAEIAVKAGVGMMIAALVCAVARLQESLSSAIRAPRETPTEVS
jgi:hypothetical protein